MSYTAYQITNLSILSGEIPQELLQGRVTPLFKNNSQAEVKKHQYPNCLQ